TPANHFRHTLTQAELATIEADIRSHLENPAAHFSGLKAARSSSGSLVVCGWVNPKDDFPEFVRYVGHRPFAATYSFNSGKLQGFQMTHFANVKEEAPPVYKHCTERGMTL